MRRYPRLPTLRAPTPGLLKRQWFMRLVPFALALTVFACSSDVRPFHGVDITGASYGQQWRLQDQDKASRSAQDYRGTWLLVYFGFTQCPDVCPLTLSHLRTALTGLGKDASQVRVLFVTVDAENDTPEVMKTYLEPFGTRFTGLTGDAKALDLAAKDFRVYAARKQNGAPGGAFEHAGFVYLLDPQGKPRLLYGPDATPENVAEDLRRLIATAS